MKRLLLFVTLALTALAQSGFAETQTPEEEKPSWFERVFGKKSETAKETPKKVEEAEDANKDKKPKKEQAPTFNKEEREVLESWQKGNAKWKKSDKPLPPGLKKKLERGGELPPGWKKKLERGAKLEPELEEKARSLPEEILKRLPKSPENTEIVRIGDEIVRIFEDSREIIDILSGGSSAEKTD
ncbi:MAG: hypothetical protein NWS71_10020 [Opitutales bacterium]|jgi:hypothetical protein|nr:hypothetical protein [Opitutales bacterium]MDP4694296.1 hypothetical protein [Opitutales bacterium]MDP4777981.1 hypothetical protein [Opitutales bacterium]MDP4883824.1 hypothetical protein [Opitutales bacterium]MDP5080539.1 hypothetical protein [Opitutales bacterium]